MTPRVYRAPGRVNLIGEHTDHNEGFVMPMAIDFSTWVAIAPRDDRLVVIRSENLAQTIDFDLDDGTSRGHGCWSDYPRGVAQVIEASGQRLRGAEILLHGDVPLGAGLSSSAAIEVATGFALLENSGLAVNREQLARLCQQAENEFVGMRCGLMDQFVSCFGQTGQALLLDCRFLEYKLLPLPDDVKIIVCNTMVRHDLATSAYNARRADCEDGVRLLAQELPNVRALRDVTMSELERLKHKLPAGVYKRCRHVVSENARTLEAAESLQAGRLDRFGKLLRASHKSLKDDYEVSCEELDLMTDLANQEGVYGARMIGGGFGGCTVNLVQADRASSFKERISVGYARATGRVPEIYICAAARGAERVQ